ncbi:DUF2339 domain-containing protein [Mycobacterium paragordonae]|uniref:DUF2339 domain-containing protein n=1 Tax=Mycobacterium paragordonae TaxID=1389713 RepID=A0A4R5WTS4_9MYCO|nr:DUF2339 domain-containing protein [Mycobacterium paragordonae]MDP7733625.1 DUF2339 domain-containing protein [Mycobacterium paragordonae]TDK96214.1 DUF2339 domain-containing protein [Mycobacterium paragordonae]TDK97654.1 DUF2339 domain-containing protein [Mycobacterium paragordonae]TDL08086.1 DUF2339 domain-containing protein [Mycobacterium paragordonae]
MTESHQAVLSRLSHEFDALARQMSRVSGELTQLDRLFANTEATPAPTPAPQPAPAPPPAPAPRPAPVFVPPPAVAPQQASPQQEAASYWQNYWQYWQPASVSPPAPRPPRQYPPRPAAPPPAQRPDTGSDHAESGWIGKLLAVAGVAVTLIGVVLLLVLAAQAGLLRPEIRVTGGIALAGALVGIAVRLRGRPGGRIGAIALAATGIATAYLDVIAIVTIYKWVAAPVGLVLAAVVGGAGLALARRWDSEHLALLVLVPLIGLAPVLTHGVNLLLISFMLALSAAALPVQLGKDWTWMHAARIAATTLPLLVALPAARDNAWLLGGACAVAAILAIASGLILLPATKNPSAVAILTSVGTAPVLAAAISVDRVLAAVLAAALAVGMLTAALIGRHPRIVTQIWLVWSAISGLIALTVACSGYVEGPVLLALAIVIAMVGRQETVARWIALGFGIIGCGLFYSYAPLYSLVRATAMPGTVAASTLAASLLVIALAVVLTRVWLDSEAAGLLMATAAALIVYAVTAFTVTAGVFIGGTGGGFLAGHMAATICWIAMAAALFVHALRSDREHRTESITAGLALTGAATGKLFLFDLATLDGIFRVAAFIIVGLVLLSMGTGYARSLAR